MPRFPTQAELAESRKKQDEEDQKLLEENPPPTVGAFGQLVVYWMRRMLIYARSALYVLDERIECAMEQKEKGSALIADHDYSQAQKYYDLVRLLSSFPLQGDSW